MGATFAATSINSLPDDYQLRAFLHGVANGLEVLHSNQIIHRDIKPDNIILRGGDWARPVIIDLGLSRLLDLTSMTVYPWAAGTWPYMAPEQLRGERAIDRTDVWALGVVAGELATTRLGMPSQQGHQHFRLPARRSSRLC
jgi:serine/threonine protein kinase